MNISNEIALLKIQRDCLKEVLQALRPEEIGFKELTSVIGPMLVANATSVESILLLAENNHYRDMIILSRPFLEGVINIGYICAEGDKAVVASKKHAYQRGYRDLFTEIKVNGFAVKNIFKEHIAEFEKAAPEAMKEALKEYTKGEREINQWAPETTKQKLEIIGKKYGEFVNGLLSFAFFSIYRDVSEVIHNSYYGVMIFTGMQQKDITAFRTAGEAAAYFTEHQEKLATLILQQVNISIVAIVKILSQEFPIQGLQSVWGQSKEALVKYTNSAVSP